MSEDDSVQKQEEDTAVVTTVVAESSVSSSHHPYTPYSIRVKPEYILSQPPIHRPTEVDAAVTHNNTVEEHASSPKLHNHKKRRPKDDKVDSAFKLCHAIIQGRVCPYGDSCKYSHDMKDMLAQRPPDIMAEIPLSCPLYSCKGYCPFGIQCRFGASHLNLATGQNFGMKGDDDDDDTAAVTTTTTTTVYNSLSKDTQSLLRKKQYPFQYVRKSNTNNNNNNNKNPSKKMAPTTVNVVVKVENIEETTTSSSSPNPIVDPVVDSTTLKVSCDHTPMEFKTRKIIDFRNKVYVAPLTTVGNLPFRRIMKKFTADITCGEMALCLNLLQGQASEWALLKRHVEEDVFGIQLAAGYPDLFIHTAEVLEKENVQVNFVDLNLGCPLDLICDKGAGARLMQRDSVLRETLEGMTHTLSCPVTIKMRTGWEEKNPFAHKLVHKIHSWGMDGIGAIMIHGRSRLQRYSKLADWDYIQQVAQSRPHPEHPMIPIIGNGDIFSYTDYEEKVSREGIECTAMLGRGALIKPWLPVEIKERRHWDISASERLDMLKDFVRFGLEHWGTDTQGVNNTRRFLLEWLSFLYRYVPVGMLEVLPQAMNHRPPLHLCGRSDLETLMLSKDCKDWIKISEMFLGKVPDEFRFEPKHKASSYSAAISE